MRKIKFCEAINEALHEEMERDETVLIWGEDVTRGLWGTNTGIYDKFGPERIRDTAISEDAIVSAAVGAAIAGYRPVVEIMFCDFLFCAGDEVFNYAAKYRIGNGAKVKVPLVIQTAIGGYRKSGPTHSGCAEGYLWHCPGLKIAIPSTAYDAKGLMKAAIRDNNPVIFLMHKLLLKTTGEVPEGEYTVPFGKADIKRQGSDVTVVATAYMVEFALQAAEKLKDRGISLEVIDPRTLEPLDIDTIVASVKKTGRVIIVDEDTERSGVTGEIAFQIMERAFDSLSSPIARVAAANLPIPGATLEQYVLPRPQDVADAVSKVMGLPEPLVLDIEFKPAASGYA